MSVLGRPRTCTSLGYEPSAFTNLATRTISSNEGIRTEECIRAHLHSTPSFGAHETPPLLRALPFN